MREESIHVGEEGSLGAFYFVGLEKSNSSLSQSRLSFQSCPGHHFRNEAADWRSTHTLLVIAGSPGRSAGSFEPLLSALHSLGEAYTEIPAYIFTSSHLDVSVA